MRYLLFASALVCLTGIATPAPAVAQGGCGECYLVGDQSHKFKTSPEEINTTCAAFNPDGGCHTGWVGGHCWSNHYECFNEQEDAELVESIHKLTLDEAALAFTNALDAGLSSVVVNQERGLVQLLDCTRTLVVAQLPLELVDRAVSARGTP